MDPAKHARLLRALSDELYASCKWRSIDSPIRQRQAALCQQAHAAADELEARKEPSSLDFLAAWLEVVDESDQPSESMLVSFARKVRSRFGVDLADRPGVQPSPPAVEPEPLVEAIAQLIYSEAMLPAARATRPAGSFPAWKGGNSLMEEQARRCARAVLAPLEAANG